MNGSVGGYISDMGVLTDDEIQRIVAEVAPQMEHFNEPSMIRDIVRIASATLRAKETTERRTIDLGQ